MSKKRASPRSYAEWDRLVDEWLESDEKQAEFAEAHGIKASTFQGRVCQSRKRRGLRIKGKEKDSGYQVVEVATPLAFESSVCQRDCLITLSTTQIEFSSSTDINRIGEILSQLGHGR